jgi:hypothetical protein
MKTNLNYDYVLIFPCGKMQDYSDFNLNLSMNLHGRMDWGSNVCLKKERLIENIRC